MYIYAYMYLYIDIKTSVERLSWPNIQQLERSADIRRECEPKVRKLC